MIAFQKMSVVIAEFEFGDIGNIEMPICQQTREAWFEEGDASGQANGQ
jgi:hypothetical protein